MAVHMVLVHSQKVRLQFIIESLLFLQLYISRLKLLCGSTQGGLQFPVQNLRKYSINIGALQNHC